MYIFLAHADLSPLAPPLSFHIHPFTRVVVPTHHRHRQHQHQHQFQLQLQLQLVSIRFALVSFHYLRFFAYALVLVTYCRTRIASVIALLLYSTLFYSTYVGTRHVYRLATFLFSTVMSHRVASYQSSSVLDSR